MLREFGAGFEFDAGTPKRVIEAALEHSYQQACKEIPELEARKGINERYDIIPGPGTVNGGQTFGWYLRFESEHKPSSSIYEITQELAQVQNHFLEIVKSMQTAVGQCPVCGFVGNSHFCVGPAPQGSWKYAMTNTDS